MAPFLGLQEGMRIFPSSPYFLMGAFRALYAAKSLQTRSWEPIKSESKQKESRVNCLLKSHDF